MKLSCYAPGDGALSFTWVDGKGQACERNERGRRITVAVAQRFLNLKKNEHLRREGFQAMVVNGEVRLVRSMKFIDNNTVQLGGEKDPFKFTIDPSYVIDGRIYYDGLHVTCEVDGKTFEMKNIGMRQSMLFHLNNFLTKQQKEFVDAYMEAALWSSNDDDGVPLDSGRDFSDIDPTTKMKMEQDCRKFLWENSEDIGDRYGQAGHDFWLTRNGHGVGFWETPDWPKEAGQRLTAACKAFGEYNLLVGDDKKIHGYPDKE